MALPVTSTRVWSEPEPRNATESDQVGTIGAGPGLGGVERGATGTAASARGELVTAGPVRAPLYRSTGNDGVSVLDARSVSVLRVPTMALRSTRWYSICRPSGLGNRAKATADIQGIMGRNSLL